MTRTRLEKLVACTLLASGALLMGCSGPQIIYDIELNTVQDQSYSQLQNPIEMVGPEEEALEVTWQTRVAREFRNADGTVAQSSQTLQPTYDVVLADASSGKTAREWQGLTAGELSFGEALDEGELEWGKPYKMQLTVRQGAGFSLASDDDPGMQPRTFELEVMFTLPGPTLTAPTNGETVRPPEALKWALRNVNARSFDVELELSTDAQFSTVLHRESWAGQKGSSEESVPETEERHGGTRTSRRRSYGDYSFLPFDTPVYWRVRVKYPNGSYTAWTPAWRFSLTLPAPEPQSPKSQKIPQGSDVVFRWKTIPVERAHYVIEIRQPNQNWEDGETFKTRTGTGEAVYSNPTLFGPDKVGQSFQWRIRAVLDKERSFPSDPLAFDLNIPQPTLVHPPDNVQLPLKQPLEFRWRGGGGKDVEYYIHFGNRERPKKINNYEVDDDGIMTYSSHDLSPTDIGQLSWKILAGAVRRGQTMEQLSEEHQLTLERPVLKVQRPEDGVVIQSLNPEFIWEQDPFTALRADEGDLTTFYHFVISEEPIPDEVVTNLAKLERAVDPQTRKAEMWLFNVTSDRSNPTVRIVLPIDLKASKTYYYRIHPVYQLDDYRFWSNERSFRVAAEPSQAELGFPTTQLASPDENLDAVMPRMIANFEGQPALVYVASPKQEVRGGRSDLREVRRRGRDFDLLPGHVSASLYLKKARENPDGKLVFLSTRSPLTEAGKNSRTGEAFQDLRPCWSPDGKAFLFSSNRYSSGRRDRPRDFIGNSILRKRGSFSAVTHLIEAKQGESILQPAWAPQGDRIAYVVERNDTAIKKIWVCGLEGESRTEIVGGSSPSFSPDGKSLFYIAEVAGKHGLWRINTDGSSRNLLYEPQTAEEGIKHPAVAPDGSRVAFVSNRTGNDDIWVKELGRGGTMYQVTNSLASDTYPCWTPDGSSIIFASKRQSDNYNLHMVRIKR